MHEILLALATRSHLPHYAQPPHYLSQGIIGNIGCVQDLGQPEKAIKWASEAPGTIVVIGQSIKCSFLYNMCIQLVPMTCILSTFFSCDCAGVKYLQSIGQQEQS